MLTPSTLGSASLVPGGDRRGRRGARLGGSSGCPPGPQDECAQARAGGGAACQPRALLCQGECQGGCQGGCQGEAAGGGLPAAWPPALLPSDYLRGSAARGQSPSVLTTSFWRRKGWDTPTPRLLDHQGPQAPEDGGPGARRAPYSHVSSTSLLPQRRAARREASRNLVRTSPASDLPGF